MVGCYSVNNMSPGPLSFPGRDSTAYTLTFLKCDHTPVSTWRSRPFVVRTS